MQMGMVICTVKTKVVVFCTGWPGPYQWHCGGTPLLWEQQLKYLGVVFDATSGISATFGALHKKMWGAWAQLRRQYGSLQCSTSVGLLLRLYNTCVPSTASYGCEVWGLREFSSDIQRGRDALGTSHLRILKELAALPTSMSTDMLLHELGQRPLSHGWWQRLVRFWNSLASLPDANLYKQVALDSSRDAIARNVQNWAMGVFQGLRKLGMRMLLGVMLCGLCTCLPYFSSWMPLHFRPARDLTYALGRARRPVPRYVHTTGGLLGRSTYAGQGL